MKSETVKSDIMLQSFYVYYNYVEVYGICIMLSSVKNDMGPTCSMKSFCNKPVSPRR